ncbi:hypothetical protein AA15973_1866 [Komagataeibacter sucrofermentans DSM 15973]|nr:hypothetical protein AA15973_1866 [Komagataeibacter sucrofermentans DSM 15973]
MSQIHKKMFCFSGLWCELRDSNPHAQLQAQDFKSRASTIPPSSHMQPCLAYTGRSTIISLDFIELSFCYPIHKSQSPESVYKDQSM